MMHHPGAPRLLQQLGIGGTARWLGDGSFSLIIQLSKVPGRTELDQIELVAGALRATGKLSVADHTVRGRLKAETLPLPAIDPHANDPLPFAGDRRLGRLGACGG